MKRKIHRRKKWTEDTLKKAVQSSTSVRQVLKKLNLVEAGGNYSQIKKFIHEYSINISHFKGKGWNKGMQIGKKPFYPLEEILVENSFYQSHKLKNRLFDANIKLPRCELCGWCRTSVDGRIPVELDHINGNRTDNRISNLRILCPNCHSLQPTHRGRNIHKG